MPILLRNIFPFRFQYLSNIAYWKYFRRILYWHSIGTQYNQYDEYYLPLEIYGINLLIRVQYLVLCWFALYRDPNDSEFRIIEINAFKRKIGLEIKFLNSGKMASI